MCTNCGQRNILKRIVHGLEPYWKTRNLLPVSIPMQTQSLAKTTSERRYRKRERRIRLLLGLFENRNIPNGGCDSSSVGRFEFSQACARHSERTSLHR